MERREGNLIINKPAAYMIAVMLGLLISLVSYIYVQDRVAQSKHNMRIERNLKIMEIHLETITIVMEHRIDPEIQRRLHERTFRWHQEQSGYRGLGGYFNSDSQK